MRVLNINIKICYITFFVCFVSRTLRRNFFLFFLFLFFFFVRLRGITGKKMITYGPYVHPLPPPSTKISDALINALSSLDKNTATFAISSGVPCFCRGT